MDKEGEGRDHHVYLDEIKQLYERDEYSRNVQEWNEIRHQALDLALKKILYPALQKDLKLRLLSEAKEGVVKVSLLFSLFSCNYAICFVVSTLHCKKHLIW